MVGQVKIVGILMMVHGISVALMGALYAAIGPMMMIFAPPPPAGGGGPPPELFFAIYLVIGLVVLACGVVHIIAGYRVMTMRNRVFGIVALFLNMIPIFTCYCGPTSIAMMVYGLIVLFQSQVGRSFELVRQGATPEEAVRRFTDRFGDQRDDYDDISDSRRGWEDERRRRYDEDRDDREDDKHDDR